MMYNIGCKNWAYDYVRDGLGMCAGDVLNLEGVRVSRHVEVPAFSAAMLQGSQDSSTGRGLPGDINSMIQDAKVALYKYLVHRSSNLVLIYFCCASSSHLQDPTSVTVRSHKVRCFFAVHIRLTGSHASCARAKHRCAECCNR